ERGDHVVGDGVLGDVQHSRSSSSCSLIKLASRFREYRLVASPHKFVSSILQHRGRRVRVGKPAKAAAEEQQRLLARLQRHLADAAEEDGVVPATISSAT